MRKPIRAAGITPQSEKQSDNSGNRRKQYALANEIAEAFNDRENLAIYQAYCRNFAHEDVKRAFDKTREVPAHRVKRSRLALFIYLLKTNASKKN